MPALVYDSAWILARLKLHARRPAVDASMADPDWFALASDAQRDAFEDIVARFPESQYGAPVQLAPSTDGGQTYALPAGATGNFELYATPNDVPDAPLLPGFDFLAEPDLIRIPNNHTRSFPNGAPWFRGAVQPGVIDAANAPTLQPMSARQLIVEKALVAWASRPASGADPSFYDARYQQQLERVLTELATRVNFGSSSSGFAAAAPWYRRIG